MKRLWRLWLVLPIRTKMHVLNVGLLAVVLLAAGLNITVQNGEARDVGRGFSDLSACESVQTCLEAEKTAFQHYLRARSAQNREDYEAACAASEEALALLPDDAERISLERFARTRNLRNAYASYAAARDAVAALDLDQNGSVQQLYAVYDRQSIMLNYISNLISLTVEDSSSDYEAKQPLYRVLSWGMWFAVVLMAAGSFLLTGLLTGSIVDPLTKLSAAAEKIAQGDFSGADVAVKNQDEIGTLVTNFNAMKHATAENIRVLRENQQLEAKVYRAELSRTQMEKQLETARLDLLQSQIHPHYLFNTLNTIAGMAELEEAPTTAQMTKALSNIFRYNLHTTSQFVSLSQEIAIAKDYLYLQKMRFGSRLNFSFSVEGDLNPDRVSVPVFTLQPLVENAVVHGIGVREEGGSITISFRPYGAGCEITVADDGVGIEAEKLSAMQQALQEGDSGKVLGIGLGNICRRIRQGYPGGRMELESSSAGTLVRIVLPEKRPEENRGEERKDDSDSDCG